MDYSICMYILPYSYSVHALVVYCTLLFSVLWTKENIIRFRWSMKKIHWWFHLVYPPIYLELGGLPAHSARSSPPFHSLSSPLAPFLSSFILPSSTLYSPLAPYLSSFILPSSTLSSTLAPSLFLYLTLFHSLFPTRPLSLFPYLYLFHSLPHSHHLSFFISPSSPIFSSLSITLPSSFPLPLSLSLFLDQKLQLYAEQPN